MTANGRLMIGVAATLAVLAAVWMTVLAPKRGEAAALSTSIAQAEQVRDGALESAATADRARDTYDRDYGTLARLGKAVPQNADVPSLVYQLETAARRAKVDFRAISVLGATAQPAATTATTTQPGGGIQAAPFSFKFDGDFFGLERMLARIDRFSRVKGTQVSVNGRLLTVDGLALNPGSKGLPRIQGIVTARAYVADLPDVLPHSGAQPASAGAGQAAPIPASEVTP